MIEPEFRLLPTGELLDAVAEDVLEIRVLENAMMQKIAELERRGAAGELEYKNVAHVLRHAVRWDLKTARQWVARAALLTREVTPAGSVLEPELPITAAAVAAGALSGEHISAVAEVMKDLPPEAEQLVVEFAREHEPRAVRSFGKELASRLRQHDAEPRESEPEPPVNKLRMEWKGDQLEVRARLDKASGAKFEAMIGPLVKPRPTTPEEGPDPRSRAERQGDAFADLIDLMLHADQLPERGRRASRPGPDDGLRIPAALLVARGEGGAFPGGGRPPKRSDAHRLRFWKRTRERTSRGAQVAYRLAAVFTRRSWFVEQVQSLRSVA